MGHDGDPEPDGTAQDETSRDREARKRQVEEQAARLRRLARTVVEHPRVVRLRARAEASTAGEIQRRVTELQVMHQAAILSALAMVLLIPALVSLQALLPIGSNHGLAVTWSRHLSLSPDAAADVRRLFLTQHRVQSVSTAVSSLFTVVTAYAWPAELQKTYRTIWGVPSPGVRDLWRPILWIPSLFCVLLAVAASGSVLRGLPGTLFTALVGLPLILGWTWWTQHLLLGGRVGWRALLPAAVTTALALAGLSIVSSFYLSRAVTYNYGRYGPIGVVFVLMSWLTSFSLLMLAGALAGHTVWRRRSGPDRGSGVADGSRGERHAADRENRHAVRGLP
ncbi:MAG TPA: YhjD/YihY/BrkB family envelope integrity protein [Jatrophihabitans sp.]|nr:YhjD/YihY/BrkB family envelope integrity protein [Jatrophihabitans sp.]